MYAPFPPPIFFPMNDPRYLPREPVSPGPPVLAWMVMLCAGAFVLRLFATPVPPGGVPPGALGLEQLAGGEWWVVLTHIFIHANLWHLVMNVALLVLAGRAVERNAGARHFFYIFLAGAWAGAALSLGLRPGQAIIGASGAVWGIIGAFAALHPEYDMMRPLRSIVPLRLKAKRLVPAFLIVHCGLEIAVRSAPAAGWMGIDEVAHLVHAGGLLAGWLYGRRLAADAGRRDEWNDFFPQGRRRQFRESDAGALPVTAGMVPRESGGENDAALPPSRRELSDSEFLREWVDPVLEKLYASGADQLTAEEKAVLEEASRRFSRGKK